MPDGEVRNASFEGPDEMLDTFRRRLRGLIRNLQELRYCHSNDFGRLTLHPRCFCLERFAEFAGKSDRQLIFHDCTVMHCIELRQSTLDYSYRVTLQPGVKTSHRIPFTDDRKRARISVVRVHSRVSFSTCLRPARVRL